MNIRATLIFALTFLYFNVNSQIRDCGTMSFDSARRALYELPDLNAFENWLQEKKLENARQAETTQLYRIPVVVHVVHYGEAVGEGANISFDQIQSQITVLNEDYGKIAGTPGENNDPVGVDTQIEFYLAPTDPDGNELAEPGVDRVLGDRSEWPSGVLRNPIETVLKPSTIWNPDRYLNIWTVNFGGFSGRNLLGYAQFPDMSGLDGLDSTNGSEDTDGVVIGYKYFGSSNYGDFNLYEPFNYGRTTTHEVGHWLGLRHIWGDGDCSVDDYCDDTPNASAANYGCPEDLPYTCNSYDMYNNYMDYTDDLCMNIFTKDQKDRMITVLENSPRRKEVTENAIITSISIAEDQVSLYYNAKNEEINIEIPEDDTQSFYVDMYNINGKHLIKSLLLTDTHNELNTNRLHRGVYIVKLTETKSNTTHEYKLVLP